MTPQPPATPAASRIYLDNAATSFPKPRAVLEAMTDYANRLGASPGRGAYAEARESAQLMNQCRQRLCQLFNGQDPNHVIFTLNTSDALNMAIRGIALASMTSPCHVITTDMDHNSVLRPFNALCEQYAHITQTRVACDPQTGLVDPDDIRAAIKPHTKLIAIVHGSNVTGTLQPIAQIGAIAREHDIPFAVDAAQSLGHTPVDIERDNIDLLAAPGHKGLLGPLGTGFLYIRPGIEKRMVTTREGGTGSISDRDVQPDFLPDRFEPGSHNAIGIIGLSAGVQWILDQTVEKLWEHEKTLTRAMIDALSGDYQLPGLTYYGPQGIKNRGGVFSIRIDGFDAPETLSEQLENQFGILTRSGIHCAPHAHRTINTHHLGGTTRFSFGPFTTLQDIQYSADALAACVPPQTSRTPHPSVTSA